MKVNYLPTNYKELGIRLDNLKQSILPYSFLTVVLVIGTISCVNSFGKPLINLWYQLYPSILIVILLSALQEVFFRGYLIFILKQYFEKTMFIILINTFIFTTIHLIFPYPYIILPGAFLVGLSFAIVYFYFPNLFLAALAHVVINIAPIYFLTR